MTRQQAVDFQTGFAALAAFELAEKRSASASDRMRQLDATWSIAKELRLVVPAASFDERVNKVWAKLREAINERDRQSPK